MLMENYSQTVHRILERIAATQTPALNEIAERIAESVRNDGVLHIFGSGHSHMIAEDAFHRAGGLACVNAMLEPSLMELNTGRATLLERLEGYGKVLLTGYDLRAGEVIVVISNSGINAVPIEIALECKARGLFVVAVTSMEHSRQEVSRHGSGKKLYEIADITLDNGGAHGDAAIPLPASGIAIGATSTLAGVYLIQCLTVCVIEKLMEQGGELPVFTSANKKDGDANNERWFRKYRHRTRY